MIHAVERRLANNEPYQFSLSHQMMVAEVRLCSSS